MNQQSSSLRTFLSSPLRLQTEASSLFVTETTGRFDSALVQMIIKVTGRSLWWTDASEQEGFPPRLYHFLALEWATVTKSDPVLTSPCVAKETKELRKREEVRQQGVMSKEKEERDEGSL